MAVSPFRRSRAKRALEVTPAPDELDFDSVEDTAEAEDETATVIRKGIAALAVSTLGLVVAGGVYMAAGPTSQRVDTSSMTVDATHSDITKAVPAPQALSFEAQAQAQENSPKTNAQKGSGGLTAFSGRSTVTRSVARTELAKAITAQVADQRNTTMDDVNKIVVQTATDAGATARGDQLEVDLKKVKAEAKRIAEEKRKAEELLKKKQAEALKNGKAAAAGGDTAGTPSAATGDVSAIVSSGGGTTPLPPGSYSVGASYGQYGSWSRWHTGQDFPAPIGTPVLAVADGVASTSCGGCQGWAGGDALIIHHANGGSTLYAHMGSMTVSPGQLVKAGQVVGYVGMKGRTFGPHLHFEYYRAGGTPGDVYGGTANPVAFLLSLGVHV